MRERVVGRVIKMKVLKLLVSVLHSSLLWELVCREPGKNPVRAL